jgi:hypothetical protein
MTRTTQLVTSFAAFPRGKITRFMFSPQDEEVLDAPTTSARPIPMIRPSPIQGRTTPLTRLADQSPKPRESTASKPRPATQSA